MANIKDVEFLRTIRFLRNWPLDKLIDGDPNVCTCKHFKSGKVLVKDSSLSDWIYVVKSGSLSIYKQLKIDSLSGPNIPSIHTIQNTTKRTKRSNMRHNEANHISTKQMVPKYSKRSLDNMIHKTAHTSEENLNIKLREPLPTIFKHTYEVDEYLSKRLPGYHNPDDRLGVINYDTIIKHHKANVILPPINQHEEPMDHTSELSNDVKPLILPRRASIFPNTVDKLGTSPPKTKTTMDDNHGAFRVTSLQRERRQGINRTDYEKKKHPPFIMTLPNITELAEDNVEEDELQLDDSGDMVQNFTNNDKPVLIPSQYIRVGILEKGQYFGVTDIIFENQPQFSLVSNGADCLMISKRFYLRYADDDIMEELRMLEIPFPSEKEMRESLQKHKSWKSHTKRTIGTIIQRHQQSKHLRKQNIGYSPRIPKL
ncbi:unnamed protein product [Owenia fusiformis]|uniref:Cyclic nucleotide-binding domain-containing protein n=1 Tax=Owenia fusiformis TaxID=6347 RepID=A0A8S4PKN7_OWEFU|nr:unnamed protein product [Owenia fusiformis]